jgi:hypothetical protein
MKLRSRPPKESKQEAEEPYNVRALKGTLTSQRREYLPAPQEPKIQLSSDFREVKENEARVNQWLTIAEKVVVGGGTLAELGILASELSFNTSQSRENLERVALHLSYYAMQIRIQKGPSLMKDPHLVVDICAEHKSPEALRDALRAGLVRMRLQQEHASIGGRLSLASQKFREFGLGKRNQ